MFWYHGRIAKITSLSLCSCANTEACPTFNPNARIRPDSQAGVRGFGGALRGAACTPSSATTSEQSTHRYAHLGSGAQRRLERRSSPCAHRTKRQPRAVTATWRQRTLRMPDRRRSDKSKKAPISQGLFVLLRGGATTRGQLGSRCQLRCGWRSPSPAWATAPAITVGVGRRLWPSEFRDHWLARPTRRRLESGSCTSARGFASRFLPTLGRPHAVAVRFDPDDLLSAGLAPARQRPCWAHQRKTRS